jgi:hypothetical protein
VVVVVAWCVRPVADMHAMLLHAPLSSRFWLAQYWFSVGVEGTEAQGRSIGSLGWWWCRSLRCLAW